MDRRVAKTRAAIINAFSQLLIETPYQSIRVKDILETANVGRATFYAHFESKEILLEEVSLGLFHHIFDEGTHYPDLDTLLDHLFWHIDEHKVIKQLLLQEEKYFTNEFKQHLEEFLWPVLEKNWVKTQSSIPESLLIKQLVATMMATLEWWLNEHPTKTSTEISHLYKLYLLKENNPDN